MQQSCEIAQFRVIIAKKFRELTGSMKASYAVGHERESNHLCQCIVSILGVLTIFRCGCLTCGLPKRRLFTNKYLCVSLVVGGINVGLDVRVRIIQ
jgi:hypothetical protein